MIIYWDVVMAINFVFDLTLLLTVACLLKRRVSKTRIFLAALTGEISMITLFINMNGLVLNIFKVFLNVLMVRVAFGYKDMKYTFYNAVYLYLTGLILGGFEYYLFREFQIGSILGKRFLLITVMSPLILYVFYKLSSKLKIDYNNRHTLKVFYKEGIYEGQAFLDSGNKLTSPISGKPIILIEKEYIIYHKLKLIPIPYNALNHRGLLYCFAPECVLIDGVEYKDVLIGLSEVKFHIDGVNALLNARMENV